MLTNTITLFWRRSGSERVKINSRAPTDLHEFLRQAAGRPLPIELDENTLGVLKGAELTHKTDKDAYRQLAEAIRVNKAITVESEAERRADPVPLAGMRSVKNPKFRRANRV